MAVKVPQINDIGLYSIMPLKSVHPYWTWTYCSARLLEWMMTLSRQAAMHRRLEAFLPGGER